jgi:hypothetical protein
VNKRKSWAKVGLSCNPESLLDVFHVAGRLVIVSRLITTDRAHLIVVIAVLIVLVGGVFRSVLLYVLWMSS